MTREEIATLLDTAKAKASRYYPIFLCAARTGLRMGELLALRWEDFDFNGRFIQVSRSYTHWKITTPKSGESRRVDMSLELAQTLKDLFLERQVEAGANGTDVPPWVFCNENGGLLHPNTSAIVFFTGCSRKQASVRCGSMTCATPLPPSCSNKGKARCMSRSRWATRRSRLRWTVTGI